MFTFMISLGYYFFYQGIDNKSHEYDQKEFTQTFKPADFQNIGGPPALASSFVF